MSSSPSKIDRRTLLIGGGTGVGLIVAYALWPRRPASPLAVRKDERVFGAFVKIGVDGRVTVAVPQIETGQGVWTALPQIVADELGAAWEMVGVEPAPAVGAAILVNAELARLAAGEGSVFLRAFTGGNSGDLRVTAGSTSVRAFEGAMRDAGAAARWMLVKEAAESWGVEPRECDTAGGFAICGERRLPFAKLAASAWRRDPPAPVPRRAAATGRLIGQAVPRLDLPAKSDGSFRFAGDVRLPDLLFASVRLAPPGGRLTAVSSRGQGQGEGVRDIVQGDGWAAAVAETWWSAEQAIHRSDPRFTAPEGLSREGLRAILDDALQHGSASRMAGRGDYEAATAGSNPITRDYWVAPAQHLGLEPLTATARFVGSRLEVWAPTQAPEYARAIAERAGGGANVTLYPMPVGDSGGRALEADLVPVAIELARRARAPVQVSLSAGAAQNHDRVAPPVLAQMSALPGAGGFPAAWRMKLATLDGFASAMARLRGQDAGSTLGRAMIEAAVPAYGIPHVAVDAVSRELPIRAGYMRGEPYRSLTFVSEGFMDELARAAGGDPLAFRMSLLGGNVRLANCLSRAATLGGWDGGGPGSITGLAAASAFGSHIALLAQASIGSGQRIEVHKLVAVVDCGRIVNPHLIRQQIEGGLTWAIGEATVREPEWIAAMPLARGHSTLGLPRLDTLPAIEVAIVDSRAEPGGVSGLGAAVLAPAVANAIAAGTGKRLRDLPLDPATVR